MAAAAAIPMAVEYVVGQVVLCDRFVPLHDHKGRTRAKRGCIVAWPALITACSDMSISATFLGVRNVTACCVNGEPFIDTYDAVQAQAALATLTGERGATAKSIRDLERAVMVGDELWSAWLKEQHHDNTHENENENEDESDELKTLRALAATGDDDWTALEQSTGFSLEQYNLEEEGARLIQEYRRVNRLVDRQHKVLVRQYATGQTFNIDEEPGRELAKIAHALCENIQRRSDFIIQSRSAMTQG